MARVPELPLLNKSSDPGCDRSRTKGNRAPLSMGALKAVWNDEIAGAMTQRS